LQDRGQKATEVLAYVRGLRQEFQRAADEAEPGTWYAELAKANLRLADWHLRKAVVALAVARAQEAKVAQERQRGPRSRAPRSQRRARQAGASNRDGPANPGTTVGVTTHHSRGLREGRADLTEGRALDRGRRIT
jgi:hypothetical protein